MSNNFNPHDISTFRFADYDKQLIINGILIYRYERDVSDKFVKVPVDEGNFTSDVELWIKHAPEYQLKNGNQEYLNDCIQWEADRCNEKRTMNVIGGYLFSDAMMELSAECSETQRVKIAKIMTDYRKGGIRTSRLKQLLFDENTGVDNYFFSDIACVSSFQEEQDLMESYYCESDFDTEEETLNYLNNSQYLRKYPKLKEKIIKDII